MTCSSCFGSSGLNFETHTFLVEPGSVTMVGLSAGTARFLQASVHGEQRASSPASSSAAGALPAQHSTGTKRSVVIVSPFVYGLGLRTSHLRPGDWWYSTPSRPPTPGTSWSPRDTLPVPSWARTTLAGLGRPVLRGQGWCPAIHVP